MATASLTRDGLKSTPTITQLADRATALRDRLAASAPGAEANRRVSSDTMAALSSNGLLKMMQPSRFGGFEMGPSSFIHVCFELARGCGSASWATMVSNSNSWFLSYWPIEAQEEVWGENPDAVLASAGVPTGAFEVVDGGYAITGRWPFASNCDNSDWYFVGAKAATPNGGPLIAGWFLVPKDALQIDQNSWHVSGLQGTGSKTLFADTPVFVPEHRMINMDNVLKGTVPGREIPDNPLSAYFFSTFSGVPLATPLLGMAQGALDWFTEAMRSKVRFAGASGAAPTAAQNPFTQERAGRAAVTIAAARTFLLCEVEEAERKVRSGKALEIHERVRIRAACAFSAREACSAVNMLMDSAGASAADTSIPIQRFWRDINAGARHVGLEPNGAFGNLGTSLFDMTPKGMF